MDSRHATFLFCAEAAGLCQRRRGEVKRMMDSPTKERPEDLDTTTKAFWFALTRNVVGIAFLFAVCYGGYCFIKYLVLNGGVDIDSMTGNDWKSIVQYLSWPLFFLIVVFLFCYELRCILQELPGLIRRSFVRYGGYARDPSATTQDMPYDDTLADTMKREEPNTKTANKSNEPRFAEQDSGDMAGYVGDALTSEGTSEDSETTKRKEVFEAIIGYISVKRRICSILANEYGTPIQTHKRIENSQYAFPIVFENRTKTFGVHISLTSKREVLTKVFMNVLIDYGNYSTECQKRFVFVECVITDGEMTNVNWLRGFASKMPFIVKLRFFTNTNGDLRELP